MVNKIKTKYEKLPLWKLSFKLAEKEGELIDIVKSGDNSKQAIRRHQRVQYKRNIIRHVMLKKLSLWKHKKLYDDLTYADMIKKYDNIEQ